MICTGDFFIWAVPNCGNPQKVQRYPREWAATLRKMDALQAQLLLPGHGPPMYISSPAQEHGEDSSREGGPGRAKWRCSRWHFTKRTCGEVLVLGQKKGEGERDSVQVAMSSVKSVPFPNFWRWPLQNVGSGKRRNGVRSYLCRVGEQRVHQALTETAFLLESIVEQTLDFINQGLPLNEILHRVHPPQQLMKRTYLRPVYDEPEFIIHNIWRLQLPDSLSLSLSHIHAHSYSHTYSLCVRVEESICSGCVSLEYNDTICSFLMEKSFGPPTEDEKKCKHEVIQQLHLMRVFAVVPFLSKILLLTAPLDCIVVGGIKTQRN